MTLPNRAQAKNFLNKELKDRALTRKIKVLPEQAQINMAEVAKVRKLKEVRKIKETSPNVKKKNNAPGRP